jgi:hypothetical protein
MKKHRFVILFSNMLLQKYRFRLEFLQEVSKNIEFLKVTFQNAGVFSAAEPRTMEGNLARQNEYSFIWISEP